MECNELNVEGLFSKSISATTSSNMVCDITNDEIKAAMFDIGDDKAPGPDGYTSAFFKKGWSVVGHDVCNAVRDFFSNGCILKEINHTFLALIPKVSTPLKVNDYRPISCCNVIYKCISKILSNRIIEGIKEVVSDNQAAFVPSRRISDNILITQELMHSYHRNRGPPRCAFKVDIQKAYDTVDWRFLETILVRFGFHCTTGREGCDKEILSQTIRSCLKASNIHNIDGKIMGRDGKPMLLVRQVKFGGAKPVNEIRVSQPQNKNDTHTNDKWNSTEGSAMMSSDQDDKVAFTLVKNYVMNTWAKFGFEKVMSDDEGMFYFKFNSTQGLEQVLERGPWLIRNIPIILTKWSPNMTLNKDEVTRVPVWVKMHKVPVVSYIADGLSIIATQIGNPLSLDAFTSKMCVETWGRIGCARALIEVSADKELKQEVIMAIPKGKNASDGHTMAKIPVEYEWKPPLCSDCHVFGHLLEQCPKKISVPIKHVVVSEDGFTNVVNRKNKGKAHTTNQKNYVGGFKVNNSKNFQYQLVKPKVVDPTSSTSGTKAVNKEKIQKGESNGIK
ncbi:methylenetetrahydrofolate reductase 1 [Tanacetum coccineum]